MKLIESKTLATAAASIEFTSIPQTYTDLVVLISSRAADTGSNGRRDLRVTINGLSTGYTGRELRGFDSAAVGSTTSSSTYWDMMRMPDNTATASTFGSAILYFPNYFTTGAKSVSMDSVSENNSSTSYYLSIAGGLQSNTSAITSVAFANGTTMAIGTTASLYGITKGTDGIVVVS
jgi:hypothetical protein